ncbi:MAG: amidohydrolase [Phycisphaerae bacterium]
MTHSLRLFACIGVLSTSFGFGCVAPRQTADLIVTGATIWTGDPDQPSATALVVRDGRFVYVGNDRDAARYAGEHTHRIDAGGARLIPGMIDAHLHLLGGGLQLARLNLRNVPDRGAFIDAVARRARATAEGRWIRGGRYSTESWPDPTQPNRSWIDAVTSDHPVLLSRMDGHGALANSVALRLAGIDREGPADPAGGEIERDPISREPTGILKESAIDLVAKHIPPPSDAEFDRALTAAMREANRHGITSVHTMSPWSVLTTLERAARSETLTLRVRQYVNESDWAPYMDQALFADLDMLRVVGFKQFMDGSLGSRTAYMAEPFSDNPPDQPNRRGLLSAIMHEDGRLQAMCDAAVAAGFSPALHAIGDEANHLALDIYEHALNPQSEIRNPKSSIPRPRIEHAQHLLPADIPRFARLGAIASMQPLHKADDGRYAERAIGKARCRTSYAFRDLLDAGASLAFGSDWPVVSLNPFLGIHAAVTGRTLDGKRFVPEQNITVGEALRAYTGGAAFAAGDERHLGKIKPGYFADFVVLERDPFTIPPEMLKVLRVRQTYLAGRRVWPMEDS